MSAALRHRSTAAARKFACGLLTTALGAGPSLAQDLNQTTLTGDWGGLRSRLHDQGVDLSAGYVSEIANNPRGGDRELTRYADQFAFGSKLDLQKLLGWPAAKFQIAITDRNGRNLSDDAHLQTLQQVQEIYGRGQTWRLTQFWYDQKWLDGTVDLKLGRVTLGEDFASFPCDFQNLTFCGQQPGNVRGDIWYNWPVSQWGTRLKLAVGPQMSVQLGVYQANPRYVDDSFARHQGLYPNNPSGTTGAMIPFEFAWTPSLGGLPGSYKVGGWYDTSDFNDVYLNTNRQPLATGGGAPLRRGSSRGAYLNFQQQVSGKSLGRGASVFLNITQSDMATAATTDRQIALGLSYQGPFAARPTDTVAVAFGSNHFNKRVAEGLRLGDQVLGETNPVPGSESVAEVFYAWKPRPYFSLQPNLQYIRHPGGTSANESVLVVGLRTSVDF